MPDRQRLDRERLDRRLSAVERALTGDDHDAEALAQAGDVADRVETLETDLATARERIDELEAAMQAVRGYVGNVRSVNEDVEQRADAALAAVDRIEARLDEDTADGPLRRSHRRPSPTTAATGSDSPTGRVTSQTVGRREGSVRPGATDLSTATERGPSDGGVDQDEDVSNDTSSLLDRLRERL